MTDRHPPLMTRMTALSLAAAVTLPLTAAAKADTSEGPPAEQLIVFVQPDASPLAERFQAESLPELRELADDAGIALTTVDVADAGGAPEAVGITPLIAYQNHRGRSIYQGRYETLDRVKNFVRTSRFLPQGDEKLIKRNLPVWDRGRSKVATPIKVTPLTGATDKLGDAADTFGNMAQLAIGSADDRFVMRDEAELGRSDRLFYVDFHPYLGRNGRLYLSLAIFSQFHCHDAVWTLSDGSVSGPIDDAEAVFAEAYRLMTDEIVRLLGGSELGDGFDVIAQGTPVKAWEELGLPLPPAPEGASAEDLASVELVQEWVIDTAAQDRRPAVQFAFPAPLDAYSGEASKVFGGLTLGDDLALAGMTGTFSADPASVTMGEPDLDRHIHRSLLRVAEYPESNFVIESIDTDAGQPAFGVIAPAVLHGSFTMKGQTIPLSVPVSVEAFLGDDGKPRLSIEGRWEVRLLEVFGIEGPPGDAPANDTLIYTCYLVFEPAA
ncbi:MAG: YceI family protein [Planctomycetota bacterium]